MAPWPLRRHARLLGYRISEGCNARTFVHLRLRDGQRVDAGALEAGTVFLTHAPEHPTVVPRSSVSEVSRNAAGFAAMLARADELTPPDVD